MGESDGIDSLWGTMPKPYSMDLRERVIESIEAGHHDARRWNSTRLVQCLAPTLKRGDIHNGQFAGAKILGVQQAIEAAGAQLLYLPPYSPDLNPIEMALFELKAILPRAAERTILGLLPKIGRIVKAFSARVQT
jgi:transposase